MYLFFFHGGFIFSYFKTFWTNTIIFEKIHGFSSHKKTNNQVGIIIPARNEEQNISDCLISIINQKNIKFEIIIVDDHSNDNTVEISKKLFRKYKFENYVILKNKKLPKAWNGKTWALNNGTKKALENDKNKYLLFLDADISIDPFLIQNLQRIALEKKYKMISIMAKLNCSSFWEKLLIPNFIFFFQKLYPFNYVNNPDKALAAAAGGCIFSDISIFKKKNLFELIKNKLIDDCNLAKEIKKIGAIWLGLSEKVKSNRKYKNLKSIWKMVERCAYEQLGKSILILFFTILMMIVIYLIWFIGFIIGIRTNNIEVVVLSLFVFTISSIVFFPTIKFYKISYIYCFLGFISSMFYILMTITSAKNYYLKSGSVWRGRKYKI
tara:strand:- start:769 stop:1908 length:1140 start_codon:yes stop_codon:yes gene_type:complete